MVYQKLFQKYGLHQVNAAVIGAGHFSTAIVTQQEKVEYLRIPVIADINQKNAENAFLKAGIPQSKIKYSNCAKEIEELIQQGFYIYTDQPMVIMELPSIEVVCEGTGVPQVSAEYCLAALEHNKHVVSISKEMDSVIGPLLKRKAYEKNLVYTPVDGDQPALLMALIEWAHLIGLTVISAGKARDGEFILDEEEGTVSIAADGLTVQEDSKVFIPKEAMKYFSMIPEGKAKEYIKERAKVLDSLPKAGAFDLCEMTIIANATGLKPAVPELTQASLRITELPVAYSSLKEHGIYEEEGIIDVHTNLRRKDEAGMGGGVYIVVKCDNAYSQHIITTKGPISNEDKSAVVLYQPYHLCGVEATTSILAAALLGVDTGTQVYQQRYDLVKLASRDIKAGERLGNDHDEKMMAWIVPATVKGANNPVPGHMITGNCAIRDIKKGEVITYSMIEDKSDTILWKLRSEQERSQ